MQRTFWALAACLFAASLGLVACGDDDEGGGGGAAGGDGNYKMTLIAGVKGDEFYITMNCGAQAEAEKQGVDLDFQGPDQFDASLQTPIVNGVIAKEPDAILIAPTDAKAMYAPIKQAADAGIKIVLVDTTLENADMAVSQIASDNVGGGKAAANALSERSAAAARCSSTTSSRASRPPTSARRASRKRRRTSASTTSAGVQPGPARQGGVDHEEHHRQEPGPEGHLRHQPVRGRGRRGRSARVRQHGQSRSSASTRVPSRSRTSRRASCRRSSPRSPPTSAPRASSRPSPR